MPVTTATLKSAIEAVLNANMSNTNNRAQAINDLAQAIADAISTGALEAVNTANITHSLLDSSAGAVTGTISISS